MCGTTGDNGVVGLKTFSFQCSINMMSIYTQLHRDTFITEINTTYVVLLKCIWYFVKLFYYALIISLQYSFSFLTESRRVVVLTALSTLMSPRVVTSTNYSATGDGGVCRLDDLCFQCSFIMIFTLDFIVIFCIFVSLCLNKFSSVLSKYYFSFLLKVGDRRLDSFFVSGGTVRCHHDNLQCHWW